MNDPATVFIVDDDEAVRDSLAALFAAAGIPARTFADAEAFLSAWRDDQPGCVVLDLKMPGMNGLELQAALSRRGAQLPIVFLSARGDIPAAVRALKGGAVDFLAKPTDSRALVQRVRALLAQTAALQRQWASLTAREREVLAQLTSGRNSKAAADVLAVSVRTIEGHRTHLMRKLGVRNTLELASVAADLDLSAYGGTPMTESSGSTGSRP